MTQFEHANITVPNIDAAIAFLLNAAPDFRVKIDQTPVGSYRWAHVGNDEYYFALQEPKDATSSQDTRKPYHNIGVNHIGMIVDNLDHLQEKLLALGYEQNGLVTQEKHGRRTYFYDKAGFEWELVEYDSEKPEERYSY
ncbi:VOC family protein [Aliivibrio sp. SR45-2]|uniref:VOC family protein n=1 Tax=Aliivibrio sp. SR45-2 TaxID=2760931 RepID=UPI0015FB388F|nr:VOC family protein [Aliivibrio sp. SR45-2]MBB1312858.1 VOC family protein [Aliivibrio sp. SR45-2]